MSDTNYNNCLIDANISDKSLVFTKGEGSYFSVDLTNIQDRSTINSVVLDDNSLKFSKLNGDVVTIALPAANAEDGYDNVTLNGSELVFYNNNVIIKTIDFGTLINDSILNGNPVVDADIINNELIFKLVDGSSFSLSLHDMQNRNVLESVTFTNNVLKFVQQDGDIYNVDLSTLQDILDVQFDSDTYKLTFFKKNNEQLVVDLTDYNLTQDLEDEKSSRIAGDNHLSTSIIAEGSLRLSVDIYLSNIISIETSTRLSKDTILSSSIVSEASLRTSTDVLLSTTNLSRTIEISSLSTKINVNNSGRTSGDISLSSSIVNEASLRTSTDSVISSTISSEILTRTLDVNTLSSSISAESTTRSSVDTSTTTLLSSEISIRLSEVSILTTQINDEVIARTIGDSSIVSIVSSEISSRLRLSETTVALDAAKESISNKNVPNGYAPLDSSGKVPPTNFYGVIPVVATGATLASFPSVGNANTLYVALDTRLQYRWTGTFYTSIDAGADKVSKYDNELIDGIKTFSSSPRIPLIPEKDNETASKRYVDTNSGNMFNVTSKIQLPIGVFYTPLTARTAVYNFGVSKIGLCITYLTLQNSVETWVVEQYVNDTVDLTKWTTDSNWRKILTQDDLTAINAEFSSLTNSVATKVDGVNITDEGLYLLAGTTIVAGPINTGGGGGGGTTGVVFKVKATTPSAFAIVTGRKAYLEYSFSSLEEDGTPTGAGTAQYYVNSRLVFTGTIQQGDISFDITNYLTSDSNKVSVTVTDGYNNIRQMSFTIQIVELSISSSYDVTQINTSAISFKYTPIGQITKNIHFVLDGIELDPEMNVTYSNRQLTYTIPAQSHGSHSLRVYAEAVINGVSAISNELYYELICTEVGITTPIIASTFSATTATQFSALTIQYVIYNPISLTANATLKANGVVINTLTVDRTLQTWSYEIGKINTLILEIDCGVVVKTFPTITILPSTILAEATTEDLALYLTSDGRSNNETSPATWSFTDANNHTISSTFSNFNFSTNGWLLDDDSRPRLKLNNNAVLTIPYKIFELDSKTLGKTIEVEFSTSDVQDYNTIFFNCKTGKVGITLTPQIATVSSEQTSISTVYKEDERVRVSFVIEKRSENRFIYIYVNGIASGVVKYSVTDDFMQGTPVNITIGSTKCTTSIYNIRIYDNSLTRYQILDNYIADMDNYATKLATYNNNQVYDSFGNLDYDKIVGQIPIMTIIGQLPSKKGDKQKVSIKYENQQDLTKSFTTTESKIDVQGTSSQYYPRKNYKITFSKGLKYTETSATGSTYSLRADALSSNVFTIKADFAESSGSHNTGMAKIVNNALKDMGIKTPPQESNDLIRTTVDGFPMVVFYKATSGDTATFLGKYNFNYDKGSDVYGFETGCESWEFSNNTSNNTNFRMSDFTSYTTDPLTGGISYNWLSDFEARYPDDDDINASYEEGVIPTNLKLVCDWIASTDPLYYAEAIAHGGTETLNNPLALPEVIGGVTYLNDTIEYRIAKLRNDNPSFFVLSTPVIYDGVTYTSDTAAYRLAKFKNEFDLHFNKDNLVSYYLITELFGMVDQRAKNQFITSWGNEGSGEYKWYFIFYDNDTSLGINNEGRNVFDYTIEYHDLQGTANVWNGANSVLWNNLEKCFYSDIQSLYTDIRNEQALTYAGVYDILNVQQSSKWCESIYNEDGIYKYVTPAVDGYFNAETNTVEITEEFLYELQGSRAEHRRWWLYNRFVYIDSKYVAGSFLSDFLVMRVYSPVNYGPVQPNFDWTITPYATKLYLSCKWGSFLSSQKVAKDVPSVFHAPTGGNLNDTEMIIYGASKISSLGDLSPKYPGTIDFTKCTNLSDLKIGNQTSGYSNTNITSLKIGTNTMLRYVDISNCPNLTSDIDVSGCENIENFYAIGTNITALNLASAGILKEVHLPASITNITLKNQINLKESGLTIDGYANISTVVIENCDLINPIDLANKATNLNKVRLIGVSESTSNTDQLNYVASKHGQDVNGNDVPTAVVTGNYHITSLKQSELSNYNSLFSDLVITFDTLVIDFSSTAISTICLANYDANTNGSITSDEISNITNVGTLFKDLKYSVNSGVTFNEFQWFTGLQTVAANTFSGSDALTSIVLPRTITSIGAGAFSGCTHLTSITLPVGLVSIAANAFEGCTSLTTIIIPDTVTTIGNNAFKGCTGLTTLRIPDNITTIGQYTFSGCTTLTTMTIPEGTTFIGTGAFSGCTNLVSLIYKAISAVVENNAFNTTLTTLTIDINVNAISASAFSGCTSLTTLNYNAINSNITSKVFNSSVTTLTIGTRVTTIGSAAFNDFNIITVTIPTSVTTISAGAFRNCNSLTTFSVNASNANYTAISGVLYNKNATTFISYPNGKTASIATVPVTVTTIANYAFYGVNKFSSIDSKNQVPPTATVESFLTVDKTRCILTVPNGKVSLYAAATGWSDFIDIEVYAPNLVINVTSAGTLSTHIATEDKLLVGGLILSGNLNGTDIKFIYEMGTTGKLSEIDMSAANIVSGGEAYYSIYTTTDNHIGAYMFYNFTKLISLVLPNSATSIDDSAVRNCTELTTVSISNGVTSIGSYVFNGCTNLTSIVLPNTVTAIGQNVFESCQSLSDVTLSNTLSTISSAAFRYCYSLIDIVIPDSVTYISSNAFYECRLLTAITMSNTITTIDGGAFYGCNNLVTMSIPATVVSIGEGAFNSCTKLTNINVSVSNTRYASFNGVLFNRDQTALIQYPIGRTGVTYSMPNTVTSINKGAFMSCPSLTSVTLSTALQIINSYSFHSCSALTSITIPDTVTNLEYASFYGCSSLTDVTLSNNIISLADALFEECSHITTIIIPNTVLSIGSNTFKNCIRMNPITFGNSIASIGQYSFSGCVALTSITLPNSVESIGTNAFAGCTLLNSITFSNALTSIDSDAFNGCTALISINLPDTLTVIRSSAFKKCSSLTTVIIGVGIMIISSQSFANCSSLISFTCKATTPPEIVSALSGTSGSLMIYVPSASLTIYQQASGWIEYAGKITAIV